MQTVTHISNFAQSFEDLNLYQKAYQSSLDIHQATKSFPRDELFGLTNQIRRCSKSICANIAEGFVKQGQSSAEFSRYLSIAIGSAGEMRVWINYCHDLGYIEEALYLKWLDDYDHTLRMLQKLRNQVKT